MAKLRSVDTHFWNDSYIVELDPIEKLLFLYLLTNPAAGLAGCFERALRQIAFDTGIDREMVVKIFDRFEASGKIIYRDGWVVMLNFLKHQNFNTNMGIAATKELNAAPQWVRNAIVTITKGFGIVPEWLKEVKGSEVEVNRSEMKERSTPEPEKLVEKSPASDTRRSHPAIVAIHATTGIYPPKEIWDELINRLGSEIDSVLLKKCFTAWRVRGYNKVNYDWTEWYHEGIPKAGKQNGSNRQFNKHKPTPAEVIEGRPYR